jgi:site-specific DNA recombinase
MLRAHKASGDRSHKHRHYLVGSLRCKVSDCRLGYGRHRGNGGIYEYFSCLSRMSRQGHCAAPYFRVETVERRLINLAVYVMLLVSDEGQIHAKPTAFYAS